MSRGDFWVNIESLSTIEVYLEKIIIGKNAFENNY